MKNLLTAVAYMFQAKYSFSRNLKNLCSIQEKFTMPEILPNFKQLCVIFINFKDLFQNCKSVFQYLNISVAKFLK